MIIRKTIGVLSVIPAAVMLASCTQLSNIASKTVSQVQRGPLAARSSAGNYKNSAMIYNVCHERWLRNGYANYTFNIEEGTYVASREIQRGKFTQTVVSNHQVNQVSSCSLDYHTRGASCNQGSRRRLNHGRTIDSFFARWEKNPGLYQSCHPVLGYPTGYGHTYGTSKRRIDSNNWLIISSVVPRRSTQANLPTAGVASRGSAPQPTITHAEQRVASPVRVRPEVKIKDYTSVTDLEIKLVSSKVKKSRAHSTLVSEFNVLNRTDAPALLAIKGWILDKNYKKYPLSLEGKKVKKGGDSEIVTLKVEPHTQMTVAYEAEGVANIKVSKQTAAMLEIMSVDGVKINLTLPNQ